MILIIDPFRDLWLVSESNNGKMTIQKIFFPLNFKFIVETLNGMNSHIANKSA